LHIKSKVMKKMMKKYISLSILSVQASRRSISTVEIYVLPSKTMIFTAFRWISQH